MNVAEDPEACPADPVADAVPARTATDTDGAEADPVADAEPIPGEGDPAPG